MANGAVQAFFLSFSSKQSRENGRNDDNNGNCPFSESERKKNDVLLRNNFPLFVSTALSLYFIYVCMGFRTRKSSEQIAINNNI